MKPPNPQSWEGQGLCATEGDPSWWDGTVDCDDDGVAETSKDRAARHEKAKAICRRCPVIDPCFAATDLDKDEGVRAGELIPELRAARAHRKRDAFEIITNSRRAAS